MGARTNEACHTHTPGGMMIAHTTAPGHSPSTLKPEELALQPDEQAGEQPAEQPAEQPSQATSPTAGTEQTRRTETRPAHHVYQTCTMDTMHQEQILWSKHWCDSP